MVLRIKRDGERPETQETEITAPQPQRPQQTQRLGNISKILPLDKVVARVDELRQRCEDRDVNARDMHVLPNGCVKIGGDIFSFTHWAFGQLCAKLKLPTDFMRKCPLNEGPASQKAIIEYWKERLDNKMLRLRVKLYEKPDLESGSIGAIRAVLTDRYSIFDNHDLLDVFVPVIEKHKLHIIQANVNDLSFHMRLVFPETVTVGQLPDGKPDLHHLGFHLSNSEVGYRNIEGDMMMYRVVCQNGLIVLHEREHLFYMKHVNLKRMEIKNGLFSAIDRLKDKANDVFDLLETAKQRPLAQTEAQSQATARRHLERIVKEARATDQFLEKAVKEFERAPHATRFGVVQAITAAAKAEKIDTRLLLEEFAGKYLLAA